MSIAPGVVARALLGSSASSGMGDRAGRASLRWAGRLSYSTTLLALNLDGIVGVWGVWGEIGLPGDGDVDIDVPATIAGTLDSCRLEVLDDRCSMSEEDIDSERSLLVSLILWYLFNAALVLRFDASEAAELLGVRKLLRSFF